MEDNRGHSPAVLTLNSFIETPSHTKTLRGAVTLSPSPVWGINIVPPSRGPDRPREERPGATSLDGALTDSIHPPRRSLDAGGSVGRRPIVCAVPTIGDPFGDVAEHVVQPETIRGERAYRCG